MIVEELYDALIEAGASEEKARAASRSIADMEGHFANLEKNISRLDQKVDQRISELDQKLDRRISELDQKVDRRISELDQKISELRSYVNQ
jgi:phage shock protein A